VTPVALGDIAYKANEDLRVAGSCVGKADFERYAAAASMKAGKFHPLPGNRPLTCVQIALETAEV
jgi:hypothetical protein